MQVFLYYTIIVSGYGGFIKIDANGNQILAKFFANSLNGGSIQLKYFAQGFVYGSENNHVIFNGKVLYGISSVGYSADSYIDQIIFWMDYDGHMNWISVFDYK